jgi:hypothetical protein
MRTAMRNLIDKGRRLGGTGAVRNARLEVEATSRKVVELDRQLSSLCEHVPPRAA